MFFFFSKCRGQPVGIQGSQGQAGDTGEAGGDIGCRGEKAQVVPRNQVNALRSEGPAGPEGRKSYPWFDGEKIPDKEAGRRSFEGLDAEIRRKAVRVELGQALVARGLKGVATDVPWP